MSPREVTVEADASPHRIPRFLGDRRRYPDGPRDPLDSRRQLWAHAFRGGIPLRIPPPRARRRRGFSTSDRPPLARKTAPAPAANQPRGGLEGDPPRISDAA